MIPPRGSRDSRKAVAVNKRHDFARLEREFITTDISLRELCRRHGITAHSLVTVQAKKHEWAEKRAVHQTRASEVFIEKHAGRLADRQAEISDEALEAIAEAIAKFRADLKATEKKLVHGEWIEVPVMRLTPKDAAILIDRLLVLSDHPSRIAKTSAPRRRRSRSMLSSGSWS